MIQRIRDYFRGVLLEAKKVSWPSRQEVVAFTALILVMVIALALYLGAVDAIIQAILSALLKRPG